MLRNLLTVGGWTMLSRLLGLVRDQLLAIFLGAGPLQDAYQIAFRIPNMFRRLLGEGAFNAAFVPLFTTQYAENGSEKAMKFAGQALSVLLTWLIIFAVLCEIFMPLVISLIAPGFKDGEASRYTLAITLTRITMPYMVFICTAALIAGILNARHHFGAAAAAYVTFNIVGIIAILVGAYSIHNVPLSSAWGITISGVIQLGALLWAAGKFHLLPTLSWPVYNHDIRVFFKRMAPGLVGSGVTQLNLTIDTIIGTLLPAGSISWLYFADRINQLPLGVLGSALGTTLLPLLTQHVVAKNIEGLQQSLNKALDYALLLTLPAAIGLITLAPLIMSGLFGYGHFTHHDFINSAQCLQAYALGLPSFILIKLFAPAFFAQGDTKTPVYIGLFTLTLNLGFNLLFYRPLAHIGPPLASTLSGMVNLFLLIFILKRKKSFSPNKNSLKRAGKILFACFLMGLSAYGTLHGLFPQAPDWPVLPRLVTLSGLIIVNMVFYGILLLLLRLISFENLRSMMKRRLKKTS